MKNKKHVLYVNGKLVQVSKKVYEAYYKELNHERYLKRKDKKNGLIYYNQYDTDEMNYSEVMEDKCYDVEQIVETKILMEKLYDALNSLNKDERELVMELFFEEKTLKEAANKREISHSSIARRRNKILLKLKELMETE